MGMATKAFDAVKSRVSQAVNMVKTEAQRGKDIALKVGRKVVEVTRKATTLLKEFTQSAIQKGRQAVQKAKQWSSQQIKKATELGRRQVAQARKRVADLVRKGVKLAKEKAVTGIKQKIGGIKQRVLGFLKDKWNRLKEKLGIKKPEQPTGKTGEPKGKSVPEDLKNIDTKIAAATEKAALARQGFKEASGDLVKVLSSRAYSFPGPFTDPDVYRALVSMAAAKIREGAAAFEKFVQELQKARKLAKLGDMTPEELAKAKEAWEQANKLARSAKEPIDILNEAGKAIGRYSNGSHMEILGNKRALYGGNTIKLDQNATTTLTGGLRDVNEVAKVGYHLPGSTLMGSNPGGINILRSPKWTEIQNKHIEILKSGDELRYWKTVTDEFWETVNKPWLDDAIARGDNFRFVSNPADDFAIFVTDKKGKQFVLDGSGNKIKSIFGREVDYLKSKGYTFQPDGSAIKAP